MPNRTATFASAFIASLLASALLVTISHAATPAASDCLSDPKDQKTPQGSHWYYRIEHPSNRHCWYLRGENDAARQRTCARLRRQLHHIAQRDYFLIPARGEAHRAVETLAQPELVTA